MKIIGLLGGTSWPSTPLYYNYLNKLINEKMGGHHSARIILYSIDYHEIKSRYPDGWDKIPELLGEELRLLDDMGPDCILICNNTLHKGYDMLTQDGSSIPLQAQVIHLVVATARAAQARECSKLLLLGTKFTMEDGFFADRLRFFGLEVDTPNEADRQEIQDMQSLISAGKNDPSFRGRFKDMLDRYKGYDGLVLGCTELPLVIDEEVTDIPILNPIHVQCEEAVKFILSDAIKRGTVY